MCAGYVRMCTYKFFRFTEFNQIILVSVVVRKPASSRAVIIHTNCEWVGELRSAKSCSLVVRPPVARQTLRRTSPVIDSVVQIVGEIFIPMKIHSIVFKTIASSVVL